MIGFLEMGTAKIEGRRMPSEERRRVRFLVGWHQSEEEKLKEKGRGEEPNLWEKEGVNFLPVGSGGGISLLVKWEKVDEMAELKLEKLVTLS